MLNKTNKRKDFQRVRSVCYGFVDASNIIYGAKAEGWFIDQKKLLDYLKRKFKTRKIFFYFGRDDRNKNQAKFLKKLESFGYTLRIKQTKWYGRRQKANCDVDLTMDMLLMMDKYDRAVVLTGDGDFLPLFEYLKKQGKEITIIAFTKRTARELRSFAGPKFIGLTGERYFLERKVNKMGRTLN